MRRKRKLRAVLLCAALTQTLCVASPCSAWAGSEDNLITQGDFTEGIGSWSMYLENGRASQFVNGQGQLQVDIEDVGPEDYSVQTYWDGFQMREGCTYRISFDVSSSVQRSFQWRVQLNGGDYHAYATDKMSVGTEMTHYETTFKMEEASDMAPRFCLNLGVQDGAPGNIGFHSLCFDNFVICLIDDSGAVSPEEGNTIMKINLNQVGYKPASLKQAVIRGGAAGGTFAVLDEKGNSVYNGELTQEQFNAGSQETTALADFSALTTPGVYKLSAEGYGESAPFRIDENVYQDLAADAFHLFYLQRCGVVEDPVYGHEACHTQDGEIYGKAGESIVSHGGWHDAGDYGRYVVAGAKAAADLLLAYENYGGQFGDDTGIPESGNGIPDILDEVKYELDWLLTMQDPATGGVYHKITGENFPGVVMPQDETEKMVISPISTTATADFAAIMAMAARLYPEEAYKKTCLEAASKAWAYFEQTPSDTVGFKNPSGIVTGEYDDPRDTDERFWAAAELYRTTGESVYAKAASQMDVSTIQADLGWQDVGVYGLYAYAHAADEQDSFGKTAVSRLEAIAQAALANAQTDSYGSSLTPEEYVWGSNMYLANKGVIMLMANEFRPDDAYVTAIEQQLHYLLGNNTTSYSYVTGYGARPAENPHHRPSQYVGTAVKGMLVGGPNAGLQDPCAASALQGAAPAACYIDNDQSYSTNEITIYWNSPLVYLIAGINALVE
ncbi:MAG: glycoside hydrolase family 9 protein [Eubacteriales bacterium]|nr:glycoside hydrolase family 9 protein [Eubacteriales bacterium]